MEELLNKLIEKGWKPYGLDIEYIKIYSEMDIHCIYDKRYTRSFNTSYRNLTSKESGLWQFVCENCLINEESLDKLGIRAKNPDGFDECDDNCCGDDYQYRLIESSLKDESELEDFLLSNIVIKDEKNVIKD